jgi:D-tyrosyl-tRNA(Tyr) deacylase
LRIVLQRVTRASVRIDGETVGEIEGGLLLLVGVADGDDEGTARRLAQKCAEMRIFADDEGRFNRSLLDISGAALVVSQFTLLADVRKGRRPSFTDAAAPEVASALVDAFADALREMGVRVESGRFGAHMEVDLVNDGPVTIVLDSADLDRPRRG